MQTDILLLLYKKLQTLLVLDSKLEPVSEIIKICLYEHQMMAKIEIVLQELEYLEKFY